MNDFCQNDIVEYRVGDMIGKGKVVGVSNIPSPIVGQTYIVEDLSNNIPNEVYPFTHFTVVAIFLKKV